MWIILALYLQKQNHMKQQVNAFWVTDIIVDIIRVDITNEFVFLIIN